VISHVLNRLNAAHLSKFLEFARPFDVRVVIGSVIATPWNSEWTLTPTQRQELRVEAAVIGRAYGNKVFLTTALGLGSGVAFCQNFTSMNDVALRFDGKVIVCCDALLHNPGAVLGDLSTEDFEEILPRMGNVIGNVFAARISSLLAGDHLRSNNCDFCNQAMCNEPSLVASSSVVSQVSVPTEAYQGI
jgi:hypothetical protein